MPKSVWDLCHLDSDALALIGQIQSDRNLATTNSTSRTVAVSEDGEATTELKRDPNDGSEGSTNAIFALQDAIHATEKTCQQSLKAVDDIVAIIDEVEVAYEDVTGRTNSLMTNCEHLLEQQHTYQQTVDVLRKTLAPFNDIEEVAAILGIPFDPLGGGSLSTSNNGTLASTGATTRESSSSSLTQLNQLVTANGTVMDPRSPEFRDILTRLAKASIFLKTHHDIMDAGRYQFWLEKLETRACSLVGRSMRDVVETAAKTCQELFHQQLYKNGNKFIADDAPVESAPLYQKFRGLSYRLRELSSLLLKGEFAESLALTQRESVYIGVTGGSGSRMGSKHYKKGLATSSSSNNRHLLPYQTQYLDVPVLTEVKQGYVVLRNELLLPFLKHAWLSALVVHASGTSGTRSTSSSTTTTSAAAAAAAAAAGIDVGKLIEELTGLRLDISSSSGGGGGGGASSVAPGLPPNAATNAANTSTTTASATNTSTGTSATGNTSMLYISLCTGVRQAFSTLLRITQLEQQLFESLFATPNTNNNNNNNNSDTGTGGDVSPISPADSQQGGGGGEFIAAVETEQVICIIEAIANATRDFLRPFIIRESSVEELCRVVSALSEDVRSQMLAMPVPTPLLKQLLSGLDGTVNDAKERLSYCAEMQIRLQVQMFEPRPSHLAYPDILEEFVLNTSGKANNNNNEDVVAAAMAAVPVIPGSTGAGTGTTPTPSVVVVDVYQTWYPPMRQTLSLLSKLYGVVEASVFEDFARRSVDLCVQALRKAAEGVRRGHPGLHGDLFLVRHLLVLREQLAPFDLRLTGTEKRLDFTSTADALSFLLQHARSMWRFDEQNGLLQLARSGLPRMHETQIDAKKELDGVLKNACFALKATAVKSLLGPMDSFLAKVTAFVGDNNIPIEVEAVTAADPSGRGSVSYNVNANAGSADATKTPSPVGTTTGTTGASVHAVDGTTGSTDAHTNATAKTNNKTLADASGGVPQLPAADVARLKGQSFLRPERIREMLESVQSVLLQRVPDLKAVMKLYIDNGVARTILLKPILQDFEVAKKKMDCIISSCLDAGQPKRDLEHLLQTIHMTVTSDLGR